MSGTLPFDSRLAYIFRVDIKRINFERASLCFGLIVTANVAFATTLYYEAFLSGIKVGAATVTVERDGTTYSIRGSAAVQGAAHLFSDWRSVFSVDGIFASGAPELVEYSYLENERKKQRALTLRDGVVEIVRNQKQRPPRPALEGMDVLTAFFIEPDCWAERLLQTGRHSYSLSGKPSTSAGGCRFLVVDDDGDRDRVHIVFEVHQGRRFPASLTTGGLLRGSVILKQIGE